ncbi:MAG: DNRLRE domain-containing protein [Deltaproteobacteria bacterium]|nr:DNRLRE domain-containing protein [Deltaproteobacteria bacterium]
MRTTVCCCSLAAALLAVRAAQANDYVSDPLTSDGLPGRGSKGGSFSPSGWTVTGEPDAVWYEIADALPSGRVEYTVTGLSLQTSLTGTDHDIFTMYQAPTGVPEPVAYSPYFRNNDFKVFTRIFGTQEGGHPWGSMKLELAFCPRGEPWYHDDVCAADCDGSALAYGNGGQDIGWDAPTSYHMAVEWGGGQMTFFRDAAALGSVSYPGEWAPQPLRVRLGSPRHDGVYPGQAFMPIGIVIRDVHIEGTPGQRTPACGAEIPDAGPPDAAAPDGGASQGELAVLADVTAASWEPGVYPDVTDLNPEADPSGTPAAVAYLRFPPIPGKPGLAVLKLHTHPYSSAQGGSGVACAVSDDTWDEGTMTWAAHPAWGACAGVALSVDPDMEVGWDVTALVAGGANVNLAVVSNDPNGVHYLSKEAQNPSLAPRLAYVLAPEGGDAGPGGSGAAGGGGHGGSGQGGGGGAGVGGASAMPSGLVGGDKGGCNCRSAGRAAALLALFGLALARPGRGLRRPRRRSK